MEDSKRTKKCKLEPETDLSDSEPDSTDNESTDQSSTTSNEWSYKLVNQEIDYGNLTNNYNKTISVHAIEDKSADVADQIYSALLDNSNLFNFQFDANTNIHELNLTHKMSLITLIKRCKANMICSPFDEMALHKLLIEFYPQRFKIEQFKIIAKKLLDNQNFKFCLYRIENNSIEHFMPNCIAQLLMEFFFEILRPSELTFYSSQTLDIVLALKSSYKPSPRLSIELMGAQVPECVLWNCFALFYFKFDTALAKCFLNYFFSSFCVVDYFQKCCRDQIRSNQIRRLLSSYLDALILSNFLNPQLYKLIVEFFTNLGPESKTDANRELFNFVTQHVDSKFPLRLKDLCRIRVKEAMHEFNAESVHKLNLPTTHKSFLLFEAELHHIYCLFNNKS